MMWFDGTDSSSITKNGSDQVSQWNDKSGNNRHATQSTDANKPLRLTDSLEFDNSNDYLELAALGAPSNYTLIVAFEVPDKNDAGNIFGFQRSNAEARYSWAMLGLNIWASSGKFDHTFGDGISSGTSSNHTTARYATNGAANNVKTIVINQYEGGNGIKFYQDNTTEISNTAYLANASSVTGTAEAGAIGRYGAYNGFYFGGKIYHILLYNVALTTQEKQDAIDFIKAKHGW